MTVNTGINLSGAVRAALDFLLKSQDGQGAWKDFLLPAGNSNVWVTAYVGDVLAVTARDPAAKEDLPPLARLMGHTVHSVEAPGDGRLVITVERGR